MSYYPIFLELEGKTVLVVGGGNVAQRKVETLIEYGAAVNIVSKQLTTGLRELVDAGGIRQIGEAFLEQHLDGAFMVYAATDDNQLNREISQSARKRGVIINAVDQPGDCDFIVPSIVRKGDLSIAVSTSGKSPALARHIRKQLDLQFGNEYQKFLTLMGCLREEIFSLNFSQKENSRIFHKVVDSDILKALAEENWEQVEAILGGTIPQEVNMNKCLEKIK